VATGGAPGTLPRVSPVVVYVLTGLAVLDLGLMRLRLSGNAAAGRPAVGAPLRHVHTWVGAAAAIVWTVFLLAPDGSLPGNALVGLLGLGLWWVTALAGLLVLSRWLPSRGRHASRGGGRSWVQGPLLCVLAHVGMVAAVLVFTWAYATSAV